MLGATIQALEVQRMTLSTLKSMNVPLADLRDSLKLPSGDIGGWPAIPPEIASAAAAAASAAMPAGKAATKTAVKVAAKAAGGAAKMAGSVADSVAKAAGDKPAAVDPTQWWTALSQQFTQLATSAMKDTATDAAKSLAGSIVKQSFDAAGETLRKAATVPGAVVGTMTKGLAAAAPKPAAKAVAKKVTPAVTRPAARTTRTSAARRKP
jgi:hypothetical protein